MTRLPSALFVVDPAKERIALAEAKRIGIPVVAIADTNCNPDEIDYPVPANDDAIRAIRLICSKIADAVTEGSISQAMVATEEIQKEIQEEVLEELEATGISEPLAFTSDDE